MEKNLNFKDTMKKLGTGKCEQCGKNTLRLFDGLCIKCMQIRAQKHFDELNEELDMFNSIPEQPGKTTYDDIRRLSELR